MPLSQLLRDQPLALVLLIASLVLALAYTRKSSKQGAARSLPSPPGAVPLLGHIRQLGVDRPWVKLKEWSDVYGPIYQVRLGLQNVVVINDAATANALLDKKSAIYSSRPRAVMAEEIVSRGLRMVFMKYNDLYKKERRLLNQLTGPAAAATYEPLQDLESTQMLLDMLNRPRAFWLHCQRYAGSLIMQVAFNKRANLASDPNIADMHALLQDITRVAVPGRYLVDSFPFLNYLPGFLAPWKAVGDAVYQRQVQLFTRHFNDVKRDMSEGKDAHCFVQSLLSTQDHGLSDLQIAFLGGVMYAAGSDTTAGVFCLILDACRLNSTTDAINTFIMAITKHPRVAAKAQEELDRVVGRDRLPDFKDQVELPYIKAIVAEVQRWRPVIAGGLPHAVTEDDVFDGYFIPKGSTVIGNAWAIHMQPDLYPQPETFKPERFIDEHGRFRGVPGADRGHFGFGFGRRVCPGSYIGERSLYIVFSRLLWCCTFAHAKDERGREVPIDENAYTSGFSSHPKPFLCDIKPRFANVKQVVQAHAGDAGLL